jgi:hydroxymethylpyrimidine/phosphomethylpyrimidine kinase
MKTVLTIAGSDPSGGAGLQADLKVFRSMGTYGVSLPTALTAQSTKGVYDIFEVAPRFFSRQLDMLLADITPDAVKVGMLYSAEIAGIVADTIRRASLKNVVVDPVTVSSTLVPLAREGTLERIRSMIFPLSRVITPNTVEAGVLTGMKVERRDDMRRAAVVLRSFGPEAVIINGGHLKDKAVDLLFDGEEFIELESERVAGEFHGTGCAFSSALAAGLALGYDVKESAVKAKDLVLKAMESAVSLGGGLKLLNL